MTKEFITIQESSKLSNKSVQTIRRAIKSKKIKFRRKKTPQGFNYLISLDSLCRVYKIKSFPNPKTSESKKEIKSKTQNSKSSNEKNETKKINSLERKKSSLKSNKNQFIVGVEEFRSFSKTMEKLVEQHNEERKSFLQLINTLQEKIFVLENQLNLLKAPKNKNWYQFWK